MSHGRGDVADVVKDLVEIGDYSRLSGKAQSSYKALLSNSGGGKRVDIRVRGRCEDAVLLASDMEEGPTSQRMQVA